MVHGVWYMVMYGVYACAHGCMCIAYGAWRMVVFRYGAWHLCIVYGAWAHGIWCMVAFTYAAWCMCMCMGMYRVFA